jgi:hypothetical protein
MTLWVMGCLSLPENQWCDVKIDQLDCLDAFDYMDSDFGQGHENKSTVLQSLERSLVLFFVQISLGKAPQFSDYLDCFIGF